jgi:hypothetical protein
MNLEKCLYLMSQYPSVEDLKEQVSLDETCMYD